jgi:hypothetical protein
MLIVLATLAQSDSNTAPAWSKEAIVALATIFIMVLLSGLRLLWKHSLGQWAVIRRPRWLSMVMTGIDRTSSLVRSH